MNEPMPTPSRPVLVTRPAGRADALVTLLTQQGLVVEHRPLVRLTLEGGAELGAACERLAAGRYTHLVVTSRTTVEALLAASGAGSAPHLVVPPTTVVVAVGSGTAAALAAAGAPASLVADGSGAALVEAMPPAADGTGEVLLPASAAASPTVPEGLAAKGYHLEQITAYRPAPLPLPAAAADALRRGEYGAIVLTSPMIARAAAAVGVHGSTAVITIGAPTDEAARTAGLPAPVQAEAPTDHALVDAVLSALGPAPP